MNELLTIRNLGKRYEGFDLEGVSLSVPSGMIVGLVGGNGAGKSTTIKAALGLLRPNEGEVLLFGERVEVASARIAQLRESVGVVFDTCAFPAEAKLREVANIGRVNYRSWDGSRFSCLLQRFELDEGKRVKDLSRGMGMKLSLAFALAHGPKLLILDEATAGLDPLARRDVLNLLREFMLEEGHGILMSSHITGDLEDVADRVVCIDRGRLVFDKVKEDLCDNPGVAHVRTSEFASLAADLAAIDGEVRSMKHAHGVDVLVPNRFEFQDLHPEIPCDRASLEDYMVFALKGELL